MATETRKRIRLTTPAGPLVFPCFIDEPDTNFVDDSNPNDGGEYKARLALEPEIAEQLIGKLQPVLDEFIEAEQLRTGKKKLKMGDDGLPWFAEEDRETGEPTGRTIFRAKMKAHVVNQRTKKLRKQAPQVVDAKLQMMPNVPPIGPGSIVKLNVTPSCWNTGKGIGMTLYMNALQLLELNERGGAANPEDMFDAEDGYEAANFRPALAQEFADDGDDTGGDY